MENRESSYYRRDGASRPPQQEGAASQRESALFTELPLDSVRRTPNSGRPAPQYSVHHGNTTQDRHCNRQCFSHKLEIRIVFH